MRWQVLFFIVAIVLSGCTASQERRTPRVSPSPGQLDTVLAAPPPVTNSPSPGEVSSALETSTGAFVNATDLLDSVCFEFLLTLHGTWWTWVNADDLNTFYDRVDASGLCPDPAGRPAFDFNQGILVGTVTFATGCDAAHRVIDWVRDDAAQTQMLRVQFEVLSGCPYELVQPLVVAVPPPPNGYTVQVTLTAP